MKHIQNEDIISNVQRNYDDESSDDEEIKESDLTAEQALDNILSLRLYIEEQDKILMMNLNASFG